MWEARHVLYDDAVPAAIGAAAATLVYAVTSSIQRRRDKVSRRRLQTATFQARLKDYRGRDPGFRAAIAQFAAAEVAGADPLEGTAFLEEGGESLQAKRRIRGILNA